MTHQSKLGKPVLSRIEKSWLLISSLRLRLQFWSITYILIILFKIKFSLLSFLNAISLEAPTMTQQVINLPR